jgi:hypothetical protein
MSYSFVVEVKDGKASISGDAPVVNVPDGKFQIAGHIPTGEPNNWGQESLSITRYDTSGNQVGQATGMFKK